MTALAKVVASATARSRSPLAATAALTVFVAPVFGATWHVDGTDGNDANGGTEAAPFKTIHKALGAASDGDRIEVSPGTYLLDAALEALVVTNAVELVGMGDDREDVTVKCTGDTRNWAMAGGKRMIFVDNASALVRHMAFVGPGNKYNRGASNGFAAYVNAGMISDCLFKDSYLDNAGGAAVYLDSSDAVLEDSILVNHFATGGGSYGVALTVNNGLARRCDIHSNLSRSLGPVALVGAQARFFDSAVSNNQACATNPMWNNTTYGNTWATGGIRISNRDAVVSNCVVTANRSNVPAGGTTTYCVGGGITFTSPGKVYNTVVRGNYAHLRGGGVYGQGYLYNCLIAENVSEAGSGGGVHGDSYGTTRLYNCTIAGNDSRTEDGVDGVDGADSNRKATLSNCIVWGNGAANYGENVAMTYSCTSPAASGTGNLAVDPGLNLDSTREPYRISVRSPCARAGEWQSWMVGAQYLDGEPMKNMANKVAMGCYAPYKFLATVIVVR